MVLIIDDNYKHTQERKKYLKYETAADVNPITNFIYICTRYSELACMKCYMVDKVFLTFSTGANVFKSFFFSSVRPSLS